MDEALGRPVPQGPRPLLVGPSLQRINRGPVDVEVDGAGVGSVVEVLGLAGTADLGVNPGWTVAAGDDCRATKVVPGLLDKLGQHHGRVALVLRREPACLRLLRELAVGDVGGQLVRERRAGLEQAHLGRWSSSVQGRKVLELLGAQRLLQGVPGRQLMRQSFVVLSGVS